MLFLYTNYWNAYLFVPKLFGKVFSCMRLLLSKYFAFFLLLITIDVNIPINAITFYEAWLNIISFRYQYLYGVDITFVKGFCFFYFADVLVVWNVNK